MSKIEQIIGEMEEYIDSCRFQPLSNSKIVVNKDEIADLLDDLRQNIPDEVRKYQRIIANRDAILKDAQDKADEMIRKANEMTSTLVSEHEIMQQAFREANVVMEDAQRQADMILENAAAEANDIRSSAVQYTDDALGNIQNILSTAIEGLTVKYDGVMRSLEASLESAGRDRQSLRDFYDQQRNALVPDSYEDPAGAQEYVPEEAYPDSMYHTMPQEEPQLRAICSTESFVLLRRFTACCRRSLVRKADGVEPVSRVNTRVRWLWVTPSF